MTTAHSAQTIYVANAVKTRVKTHLDGALWHHFGHRGQVALHDVSAASAEVSTYCVPLCVCECTCSSAVCFSRGPVLSGSTLNRPRTPPSAHIRRAVPAMLLLRASAIIMVRNLQRGRGRR
jgi:hypothetical protein